MKRGAPPEAALVNPGDGERGDGLRSLLAEAEVLCDQLELSNRLVGTHLVIDSLRRAHAHPPS